jgi:vacuolar-type H+-ATPase subunit H
LNAHVNVALTTQDRTKRVKDARSEAQKEVEEYKKEKEDEYQKFEKEVWHRCPVARMP